MAVADVAFIQPIGELREGHILPGDHMGFDYEAIPGAPARTVVAPADGTIARIERHQYKPEPGFPKTLKNYHLYLSFSCDLYIGYVHITTLDPALIAASPALQTIDTETVTESRNALVGVPVKAGQALGTVEGLGLLGMVTVDLGTTNAGYLNPESYQGENWRVHSVAPFEYFSEPVKSQLYEKLVRTAEPRGGKIDYDIDGTIVGNWFEVGSNGFEGNKRDTALRCGNFVCPYWDGHLALVYDYVDPEQLRISIGHDWGLLGRTPFGVKGNSPDPATIGVEQGPVKYELVGRTNTNTAHGITIPTTDIFTETDESQIFGTMLVELLEPRTLKVEVFPGKGASRVSEFTDAARTYER